MYLVKYSCDNCRWVSWWILSFYYNLKLKPNISELSPKCLEFSEGTQLICPSFRYHDLITPVGPGQTTSCWRQPLSILKNDILGLAVSLYLFNSVFNFSPISACRWWSKQAVQKINVCSICTVMICFHLKSKYTLLFLPIALHLH